MEYNARHRAEDSRDNQGASRYRPSRRNQPPDNVGLPALVLQYKYNSTSEANLTPYCDEDRIAGFRRDRVDRMGQSEPALRVQFLENRDVEDDGKRPLQFHCYPTNCQIADGMDVGATRSMRSSRCMPF